MSNTGKYSTTLFVLLGVLLFCLFLAYGSTQSCYELGCLGPAFTYLALLGAVVVVGVILAISTVVAIFTRAVPAEMETVLYPGYQVETSSPASLANSYLYLNGWIVGVLALILAGVMVYLVLAIELFWAALCLGYSCLMVLWLIRNFTHGRLTFLTLLWLPALSVLHLGIVIWVIFQETPSAYGVVILGNLPVVVALGLVLVMMVALHTTESIPYQVSRGGFVVVVLAVLLAGASWAINQQMGYVMLGKEKVLTQNMEAEKPLYLYAIKDVNSCSSDQCERLYLIECPTGEPCTYETIQNVPDEPYLNLMTAAKLAKGAWLPYVPHYQRYTCEDEQASPPPLPLEGLQPMTAQNVDKLAIWGCFRVPNDDFLNHIRFLSESQVMLAAQTDFYLWELATGELTFLYEFTGASHADDYFLQPEGSLVLLNRELSYTKFEHEVWQVSAEGSTHLFTVEAEYQTGAYVQGGISEDGQYLVLTGSDYNDRSYKFQIWDIQQQTLVNDPTDDSQSASYDRSREFYPFNMEGSLGEALEELQRYAIDYADYEDIDYFAINFLDMSANWYHGLWYENYMVNPQATVVIARQREFIQVWGIPAAQ